MKKFLSLITLLLLVVSVNNAYAGKPKQLTSTITWELKKDGTLVIEGTGEMPDFEDGEMSPWFKKAEKITAVRIGEGITTVGRCSFENCSLYVSKKGRCYNISKVTLPSSLKAIGWCAFCNNKITSLIIPDSVTSIGGYAFEQCSSLKSVTIGDSVTTIGYYAFRDCGLQSVTIPDSVTDIGEYAFYDCRGLKKVYISDILAWCMISVGSAANPLFHGASLYLNNELVTNITIPDGITKIGANAFQGCSSLKSVTIPDSVTSIGEWAFNGCRNLESVTIGDGVTKIGRSAFENCSSLTNLTIGAHVTTIEKFAFEGNNLTSLTIPNSVMSIGWAAFAKNADSDNIKEYFNGTLLNLPLYIEAPYQCDGCGISVSAFKRYEEYKPDAETCWHNGLRLVCNKEYKKALEHFLKGIEAPVRSSDTRDYRGWSAMYAAECYEELGDITNALSMYKKANSLGEDCNSRIKRLEKEQRNSKLEQDAESVLAQGNYAQAFSKYIELYYEKFNQAHLLIVPRYLKDKKDYTNAITFYKEAYKISNNSSIGREIGELYETIKSYNEAIKWFEPLAEIGNKDDQYKLGGLYEKAKNKNLAIFWYRKAAEQQYLKAEEALAKYGIYIEKHNNQNKGNSNHNNHNHSQEQKQQTYTPEYGVRDVWVNCFDCHGTGKCSYCNGTGWCISTNGHGEYNSSYKCTICHGSGRCTYCYGSGGHYEKQQYQIR